jgi:FMN phosphatase YigB (HAD superfamily)
MYRHASDALGVEPAECLFVDDAGDLVQAAMALGYRGVVVSRNGEVPPEGTIAISTLTELLELIDG